jgi:hypothetical protein
VVGERDDAQAVLLVRALCDLLHEMTQRLERLDGRDATGNWPRAIRLEAAALRRDIVEARRHIDQLERRYLNRGAEAQPSPSRRREGSLTYLVVIPAEKGIESIKANAPSAAVVDLTE